MIRAPSVADLLRRSGRFLRRRGIDDGWREARLLLDHVLRARHGSIALDPRTVLPRHQRRRFHALMARRCRHEPFSRINGSREFWSLNFTLDADTLDPRPDSEALIEAALEHCAERSAPYRILDLGTGSGCLLLALLSELPEAFGIGVDLCAPALARANAGRLGYAARARFIQADWGRPIRGPFDIIVANPPYIPTTGIADLPRAVRDYDPRAALDGGIDGMEAYRRLLPDMGGLLAAGGRLFLEIDPRWERPLEECLEKHGLAKLAVRRDLGGRKRCLAVGPRPAAGGGGSPPPSRPELGRG